MIISEQKKIIIFFNPKTGTSTLFDIIDKFNDSDGMFYYKKHTHLTYTDVAYLFPDIKLSDYKIYAFARDPVDRFLSAQKFICREFYGRNAPNNNWVDMTIDDVHMFLEYGVTRYKTAAYQHLRKQVEWLDYDGIEIMNFNNFELNCQKILSELGITCAQLKKTNISDEIPIANKFIKLKLVVDYTQQQLESIKNLYEKDYEFFDERGIKFV